MATLKKIGALWGILGIIVLLLVSVYRLSLLSLGMFDTALSWYHWVLLVLWSGYMLYSEGYKAFGKSFSPRAVARAQYLAKKGTPLQLLLAPFFCFGYFHAPKKRLVVSYSLTAGIILFIVLIRLLPHPWRGIIDAGAVLGLTYGLVTMLWFGAQGYRARAKCIVDPGVVLHGTRQFANTQQERTADLAQ